MELESRILSLEELSRIVEDQGRFPYPVNLQEEELFQELTRREQRIEDLEDMVGEFQDFLNHNPDVKETHDLRRQLLISHERIQELEDWFKGDYKLGRDFRRIEKGRIFELERTVSQLEDFVTHHNIDGLKKKLRDREERIAELSHRLRTLESRKSNAEVQDGEEEEEDELEILESINQKMKEMEQGLSEKDNRIQELEQKNRECHDELQARRLEKIDSSEGGEENFKEEIKNKNERIGQLENEIDCLESAFNDRIEDLEQIETLMALLREKEERERHYENEIREKNFKIEELSRALEKSLGFICTDRNDEMTRKTVEKVRIFILFVLKI